MALPPGIPPKWQICLSAILWPCPVCDRQGRQSRGVCTGIAAGRGCRSRIKALDAEVRKWPSVPTQPKTHTARSVSMSSSPAPMPAGQRVRLDAGRCSGVCANACGRIASHRVAARRAPTALSAILATDLNQRMRRPALSGTVRSRWIVRSAACECVSFRVMWDGLPVDGEHLQELIAIMTQWRDTDEPMVVAIGTTSPSPLGSTRRNRRDGYSTRSSRCWSPSSAHSRGSGAALNHRPPSQGHSRRGRAAG